ncbi:MAG: hypothetical protein GF393_04025 [Armatimonadia bacterium]|nr:hypothetical protein [Armatimonadia bacterium]
MADIGIEELRNWYNMACTLCTRIEAILMENEPITDERITFLRKPPHQPVVITPDMLATWSVQYPSLPVERCVRQCAEHHNKKAPDKRIVSVDRAVVNWLNNQIKFNRDHVPTIRRQARDAGDVLKEGL